MECNRPGRYKFRNRKKKIYIDWSHTEKEDGEITKSTLQWNPQGSRKRGRPNNS
jgi:hypothetical protein